MIGIFEEMLQVVAFCGIGLLIWLVVRAALGRRKQEPPPIPSTNEEEVLRRLSEQLERMERRMENLETILMDREHKGR